MNKYLKYACFLVLMLFIPFNVFASNNIKFTNFNITVGNTLPIVSDENYIIEQHWYEDNNELMLSDQVESNKTYTYSLTIKSKEDNVLEDDITFEFDNVNWINSSTTKNEDGTVTFVGIYKTPNISEKNSSLRLTITENVKNGWYIENNNTYYYINGELQKGFKVIDNKTYFFSNVDGRLKKGWQSINGREWFYCDNNGVVVENSFYTIDGKTYYFDGYYREKGFKVIDNKTYFFSNADGRLKKGWQSINGRDWFYCDNNGVVVENSFYTIDGKTYYFDGYYRIKGFKEIGDKTYFFSNADGRLKKGWQSINGRDWFYCQEDGSIVIANGFISFNENDYYFVNKFAYIGFHRIGDSTYYFEESNSNNKICAKVVGYKKIYNSDYYFDENGKLYKIQYNPIQYYQNDSRWANVSYNGRTMKSTGCAPTSMAMAFSTILRRYVSPVEVANYLYYHTNTFNRWCMGADGNAIVMAANYFGVKRTALDYSNSVAIKNALKAGKIVFAAMGNGKFGGSTWNHAIVLSGLDQYGRTYAYDPLFPNKNGWVSVDQIIREHSAAADDAWGGSYFHALESYNVYI